MSTSIEKEFVNDTYDHIADEFSKTRYSVWKFVGDFLNNKKNLFGLDIGCGNGKNMIHDNMIGLDNNRAFVHMCNLSGKNVVLANCIDIPFHSNTFDYVICISVIHHLSTDERRKDCIWDMLRVLKKGGQGLMNVWSCENQSKHIFVDGCNYVPWKSRTNPEQSNMRYYNIMNHDSFMKLINSFSGYMDIMDVKNEKGNWIVQFVKK